MLRADLNKIRQYHTSNNELYVNIPKITITIRKYRMRFSGHCWRNREVMISEVLLCDFYMDNENLYGRRRRILQYTHAQLSDDSGCTTMN